MDEIKIDEWTLAFRYQSGGWRSFKLSRKRPGKKKHGVRNSFFIGHNGERLAKNTDEKLLEARYPMLFAKVNEVLRG